MWRGNFCGRRGWSEGAKQVQGARRKLAQQRQNQRQLQRAGGTPALGAMAEMLFGFLHGFEVGFQGGAILFLGLEFGLEFLDQQFEAADFVAQLLCFG
jgi:hypothetical protein